MSGRDDQVRTDDLEGPERIYAFADRLQQGVEEEEEEREELVPWVTFRVGSRLLALPVSDVQEIVRVGRVTRVPGAPESVLGVTAVRDRVLPLVDLGQRLGRDAAEIGDASRVLVVSSRGRLIGLLVDEARRIEPLAPSRFERVPPGLDLRLANCLSAVLRDARETLLLLDTERVLLLDAPPEPTGEEAT